MLEAAASFARKGLDSVDLSDIAAKADVPLGTVYRYFPSSTHLVLALYLRGEAVQLRAPYSGELFAADPRFERKVSALSQLWRSHRFGGVPS